MNYKAHTLIDGSVALVDAATGKTLDITHDYSGQALSAEVEGNLLRVHTMRGAHAYHITEEGKLTKASGQNHE